MLTGLLGAADITAVKTEQAPVIDGRLDDRAHFAAAAAKSLCAGFFGRSFTVLAQYQPLMMLSYDSEFLYVGCLCPFPSENRPVGSRKFSWHDDLFQILIGSRSFAVNAAGASEPSGIRSAALIGKGYWTAEMAIPWKLAGVGKVKRGDRFPIRVLMYQTAVRDWLHWLPLVRSADRKGIMELGDDIPVAYRPHTPEEDNF